MGVPEWAEAGTNGGSMRFETRTIRIGERVGDIDWSYDFESHGWDREGHSFLMVTDAHRIKRIKNDSR